MKVSTENTENRQTILSIEADPDEMKDSLDMAYKNLKKRVNIPGFRKGKTPRSILENYIGKEELQKEALENLVPQLCNQAMMEQEIDAITQPEIEIVQVDPVIFKATFPLRPEVELGDYRSISAAPDPVEVSEEQINATIERLREQYATLSPVERALQFGDMAIIDMDQLEDGEVTNTYEGQQLPMMEGAMVPLPGFAEKLVGMNIGEEREFTLEFDEEYPMEQLRGQMYSFKVRLTEVKEKQLPELDDDFAKNFGGDVNSVDDLRKSVEANLRTIAEGAARRAFEQKVVEEAVEKAKVEYPPVLEEQEISRLMSERDGMLQGQGGLEMYLKNMNKTEEEMRDDLRPEAARQLIQSLVLGKMASEEKIEVSAEDIDAEIQNVIISTIAGGGAGGNADEMKKTLQTERGRLWVEERLVVQKTVECLTQIASDNAAKDGGSVAEEASNVAEEESVAEADSTAVEESGKAAEEEG